MNFVNVNMEIDEKDYMVNKKSLWKFLHVTSKAMCTRYFITEHKEQYFMEVIPKEGLKEGLVLQLVDYYWTDIIPNELYGLMKRFEPGILYLWEDKKGFELFTSHKYDDLSKVELEMIQGIVVGLNGIYKSGSSRPDEDWFSFDMTIRLGKGTGHEDNLRK